VGLFEHTPQHLDGGDDPCFGFVESSWSCSVVAATRASIMTTTAARQLLCGCSRFRGEWGHIPVGQLWDWAAQNPPPAHFSFERAPNGGRLESGWVSVKRPGEAGKRPF
jgi:hypothetical protein